MTYDYDPELANQLLDEAGWIAGDDGVREKDGVRLESTLRYGDGNIEESDAMAQAIASQLAEIGADISIEAMEFSTFSEQNRLPQEESPVEMALARFGTGDPDTGMGSTLHSDAWPPAGNNFAFYSNPEVDEALDAGGSVFDTEERRPHYELAQRLVMEDAPWIFLTERQEAVAWHDYVSGIRFIPTSAGLIDVRSVTVDQ
jgi:peptide/nickel transport system substrate-binding protein